MRYSIIGLGNPGPEYATTRHNIGRMAVERFAAQSGMIEWRKDSRLNALRTSGEVGGHSVLCIMPETFMNRSGESVRVLTDDYPEAELIVVHDDTDLPLGAVRISYDRSAGGHNGVQSIIDTLESTAFTRVRLGVAPADEEGNVRTPHGDGALERFVLGSWGAAERDTLNDMLARAGEAITALITDGREAAMNRYN